MSRVLGYRMAVVLLIGAVALSGAGVGSARTVKRSGGVHPAAAYTMRIQVFDAVREVLTVRDRTLSKGRWRSPGPVDAKYLTVADQTMESENNQANGDTRWRIGSSNYLLKIFGNANSGKADCAIQDLQGNDTSTSSWSCKIKTTSKNDKDWDTYVVLQPTTPDTSSYRVGNTRREVYQALCGDRDTRGNPLASCMLNPIDLRDGALGGRPLGWVAANCSPGTLEIEDSVGDTTSSTNTVGGSIGVAYKAEPLGPFAVFEAKLEATWEFNWGKSYSWKNAAGLRIHPATTPGEHRFGWLEVSPFVRVAKADIVAKVGDQTFDLPDVVVKAPPTRGGRSGLLPDGGDVPAGYCEGNAPASISKRVPPDPVDAEQVYAFGLQGFNHRVIAVPNDRQLTGEQLKLGQLKADRPTDRWQLTSVADRPGYVMIRSDQNLSLCISEFASASLVDQHTCKAADDRTLNNQLWKLVPGAQRGFFWLEGKTANKVIGVSSTNAGTSLKMVNRTSPGAGVRTQWQLVNPDIQEGGSVQEGDSAGQHRDVSAIATAKQPPAHSAENRTIRFAVINATNAKVGVADAGITKGGSFRDRPATLDPLGYDDYTVESFNGNVGARIKYRLPNGHIADVDATNPLVGNKTQSCTVSQGDAFYACRIHKDQHGYNDVNLFVVIEPKTAATHTEHNPAARATAMGTACQQLPDDPYLDCNIQQTENVGYGVAPVTPVGQVIANCGRAGIEGSTTYEASQTTSFSGSVGLSLEIKAGAKLGVQGVFKAYYKHTWGTSHTTTPKNKHSVPARHYAWLEQGDSVANVRGDWKLVFGNQTYELPNVTITVPAATGDDQPQNKPVVIARGGAIPNRDEVCDGQGGREFLLPIASAPSLGRMFRIGINEANARVITDQGDAKPVKIEILKNTKDFHQYWEFSELPDHPGYYLIRNAADPLRCLDANATTSVVSSQTCKTGSESSAGTQLWSVDIDPTANGFRFINKTTDKQVLAAGREAGATVSVASNPLAVNSRWVFVPQAH